MGELWCEAQQGMMKEFTNQVKINDSLFCCSTDQDE